ncbi:phage tail tip lysozyme [Acinetobacter chengduensis]|uniref:Phage tail lysozyme domain-containing protein n=1 Tax=Acinetobacter chengduensis TaxID=2420890 RepID=A0ABX9TTN1_9GAMM|nr:phage tail tip lysozyme [Acinetobacter chengduensis]RLL19020.1 hypothetical protein D9K81_14800 [Acinetobacter chengduensis]
MAIQTDAQGFLVGERRLVELRKGLDNVHSDTAEILALLKSQLIELSNQNARQRFQTNKLSDAITSAIKTKPTVNVTVNLSDKIKPTRQTGAGSPPATGQGSAVATGVPNRATKATTKTTVIQEADKAGAGGNANRGAIPKTKQTDSSTASSERDARGRFVSSASTANEKAIASAFKNLSAGVGGVDASSIDPTIDAVRELGSLLSPAKGAFKLMGRGAMWLYKKGKPKRNEELPSEQRNHNTEVERNNSETRKLFRKLIDAVNRQRSRAGGLFDGSRISVPGRNGKNGRNGPGNTPTPVPGRDGKKGGRRTGGAEKILKAGRKLPLIGALVGGGLLASKWADMDAKEKGGGLGSMAGMGLGGLVGSALGPVGAVAGATIGSAVGDIVGQKIGGWTERLQGQDIGGTIVKSWNTTLDGINKMVKDGWNSATKIGSNIASVGGFGFGGMMLARYSRNGSAGNSGGTGGGYGEGLSNTSGGTSKERLSKEADYNQSAVYNSLIKAKFSKSQAQALTAEIGREGGYSSDHLYGTHTDRANNLTNIGMISWQGERGKGLRDHLTKRGVFKDGRIIPGQAALDAQAEYMKMEIDNNPLYAPTKAMFEKNPDADPEQYSKTIGKNYIGWAYGQKRLKSGLAFPWEAHDARRRGHLKSIQKKTEGVGQQASKTPKGKIVSVNAVSTRTASKPLYVSNYPKATKVEAVEKPDLTRRTDTKSEQSGMMASAGNGSISQVPADRDIAHAITGGLGMRAQIV